MIDWLSCNNWLLSSYNQLSFRILQMSGKRQGIPFMVVNAKASAVHRYHVRRTASAPCIFLYYISWCNICLYPSDFHPSYQVLQVIPNEERKLMMSLTGCCWCPAGVLHFSFSLSQGLHVPSPPSLLGIYIFKLLCENGKSHLNGVVMLECVCDSCLGSIL